MNKRLLVCGALATAALGIAGCSTTTNHYWCPHMMHSIRCPQCCRTMQKCKPCPPPAANCQTGTWTMEEIDIIPVAPAPQAPQAAQVNPTAPAAHAAHGAPAAQVNPPAPAAPAAQK